MQPIRKKMRLIDWDYSAYGSYFLTLCTKNRRCILSRIVGRGILDAPDVFLTEYGSYVQESLQYLAENTHNILIHNWVIMPNHVHILLSIENMSNKEASTAGVSYPTNSRIPKFVSSLKRFTNRRSGMDLWQSSYYDHIIRDDDDFSRRWRYIDNNPFAWLDDEYYCE